MNTGFGISVEPDVCRTQKGRFRVCKGNVLDLVQVLEEIFHCRRRYLLHGSGLQDLAQHCWRIIGNQYCLTPGLFCN